MFKLTVITVFTISLSAIVSCCEAEEAEAPALQHFEVTAVDSIAEDLQEQDFMIGHPADACFGPSGEVLVLDQTAACVYVFSREGILTDTFGGSGSGPGEMGNPMSIETAGELIMVRDAVKHGYLLFDGSYSLVEEVSHWPTASPTDMVYSKDSSFAARATYFENGEQGPMIRREISRYRIGEAQPSVTYFSDVSLMDLSNPSDILRMGTESIVFTADPDGNVYISEISGERYLVEVFSPGGELLYSISRDLEPVEKSQEELDEEIWLKEAEMNTMGVEGVDQWVPDPLKPMITGLGIDGDMNLWVQRGTEDEQCFDIFGTGSRGEMIGTAVFHRQGNDWNFRISPSGILAWQNDPPSGAHTIYVLDSVR